MSQKKITEIRHFSYLSRRCSEIQLLKGHLKLRLQSLYVCLVSVSVLLLNINQSLFMKTRNTIVFSSSQYSLGSQFSCLEVDRSLES